MERKWFKGDTHLHTLNSDGVLTLGQLVEECKKKGLDFMIVTDHNFNTVDESYYDGELLVIQGQEVTAQNGHVNVWGERVPVDPPYNIETDEDFADILTKCKEAGATVSVNHPFCSNCGYRLDLEYFPFDCVEVWNTIQHSDNMKNRDWWVSQLLKGRHIGAVGGSDYHRNVAKMPLLAMPTTIVHAKSNSKEDILQAMREGRSVVTNSPSSTMIYMNVGDAQIGDTASLSDNQKLELKITNLKRGHKVTVYNNEKVIYENVASKNSESFMTAIDVEQAGFVRAEVTFSFTPVLKKAYSVIEKRFINSNDKDVPDFIWAFTNPIWISE